MKSACLSALLLLSAALPAQAPVPLAHGDVPGEPHHHLKVENTFVRAYYVEVAPHADTQLHQHDHDYIFVTLGATDVINAVLGKPEARLVLKDGEVHFSRGGFAHIARNLSDAPFRNVTIEFLHGQGEGRNVCAEVLQGSPVTGVCAAPVPNASMVFSISLFDTDETSARLYSLSPTVAAPPLTSNMDHLLVVYDQSYIESHLEGESPRALRGGDLLWLPAGSNAVIRNTGVKLARYLLISFKDSASAKKP